MADPQVKLKASKRRPKGKAKPETAGKTPFLRVLPLLIILAVLMLSVRINDIRKGVLDLASVRVASDLNAQQSGDRPAPAEPPPQQVAQAPAAKEEAKDAPATSSAAADQGNMSQSELDVLQKLSDRRAMLDTRERDIERREALLKAAEGQIERKISEMKTLQNTIEGLLRQYNEQEDNKMRSLVKIYENMKPKEAAKIFEQLDMPIMLEVVERMKEQRVAPILAEMDPGKARNLTAELAQRRQIPALKQATGAQ